MTFSPWRNEIMLIGKAVMSDEVNYILPWNGADKRYLQPHKNSRADEEYQNTPAVRVFPKAEPLKMIQHHERAEYDHAREYAE